MSDFERIVTLRPAFDRRDPDPNKNYGIHGVELHMVLRGPKGATQFLVDTNWQLPHVTAEEHAKTLSGRVDRMTLRMRYSPLPADVGYHSAVPMYEGQPAMEDCPHVPGGVCYYDGSGLRAEEWFHELLSGGSDRIWELLEEEYRELFDDAAAIPREE